MQSLLKRRDVRLTLLIALVFASLAVVYGLRDIFAPLFARFLIAYMLDPLADALQRRRFSAPCGNLSSSPTSC